MKTLCKRLLSVLLVFVLVLGLMPSVYAATDQGTALKTDTATTAPGETTAPTESVPDVTGQNGTESTLSTEDCTENFEKNSDNLDSAVENESDDTPILQDSGVSMFNSVSNDYAVMAAATESGYALFDYTGSGCTTRLSTI